MVYINLIKQLALFLFSLSICSLTVSAETYEKEELYSLSLEELLNVKISTGSLFSGTAKDTPAAITIINREKIDLSGAKNLANLLEQHVPGLMVMTHSEGNKIGLRGHIAAENYKLLLLVNGKNITNLVYEGVITEIDQWELGDIERVEVVRGPGSVTYGTGAIAGVINIITKSSQDHLPTFSFGLARNETYNSQGVNLQFSKKNNNWGVYSFFSYRESKGLDNPDYFQMNENEPTDIRYVGKGTSANASPQDFLADTHGRPQIKAHIDVNYGDNFNAWLRYTESGQVRFFSEKAYVLDDNGNNASEVNKNNSQTRSLIISSDYKHTFSDNSALTTSLTFDTQEYIRFRFANGMYDAKDANNIKDYAFAQDRLTFSTLYDFHLGDKLNIVAGYEYSNIDIGAPWNKNKNHLWIREGTHLISSWDNSVYTQDITLSGRPNPNDFIEIDNGLRFKTHSLLLESKYDISNSYKLYYAHRLDYPDDSDKMFSPRLSLVSELDKNNTFVSTIQRAQRMMPLRAQYLNDLAGNSSKHEVLDSIEFSYTNSSVKNTSVNIRAYYNEISAVGYTGEKLEFLTDVNLLGLEFTGTYKHDNLEVNLNHAFMQPTQVNMNDDLKTGTSRNNISFKDYYYYTRQGIPILLESYGDGLNNLPVNISKLSIIHSFMGQRLKAHLNAQIYWDYDGSYDEMRMYQQAYDTFDRGALSSEEQVEFEQQYQVFLKERELLEAQDAFELDFNINASLEYLVTINKTTDVKCKVFVENIFRSSNRYNVSTGSNRTYPTRLEFLDKPRMFGASIQVNF